MLEDIKVTININITRDEDLDGVKLGIGNISREMIDFL
jgi:hypothetical protein